MSLQYDGAPATTDTVVIGSGFGGSVVAARLAEAGREVCLLERGNAYPPGSFARSPADLAANFWSPGHGRYGMFDAWSFNGIDAIVSSGLGGGSLIYANVLLRKDPSWFTQPHPYQPGVSETWGVDYDMLAPHYDRVEKFLDVQQMPFDEPDLPPGFDIAKTVAMRDASTGRGHFQVAPLAVRFRDADGKPAIGAELPPAPYGNIHGSRRRTCRMLGECDVGCNEGAKSSLDHTYLSSASHHGAGIFVRHEVRAITRRTDGRFEVEVRVHGNPAQASPDRPSEHRSHTIVARQVIVSAGTLGSSYLMLVNRDRLGATSPCLGTRFSGNGDLLGFLLNADRTLQGMRGPVITSYIRYPDAVDTGDSADHGMYVEDAGYPAFAAWLAELTEGVGEGRRLAELVARRVYSRLTRTRRTNLSADISHVLGKSLFTERSMPVLGMGRDIPDGTLFLQDDADGRDPVLDSTWTTRTSTSYFRTMTENMSDLGTAIGADFHANPTLGLLRRVITVHPLGGCPMRTTASPGFVDELGRVADVPGLRVCDGSVFPGPVGANPSLTIAAFADRVADNLLDEQLDRPSLSLAASPKGAS